MRRIRLLASWGTVALFSAGCQDLPVEPTPAPVTAEAAFARQAIRPSGFDLVRPDLDLPAGTRVSDLDLGNLARRAINPGDYVCPPSTPVSDWYLTEVFEFINQEPALFDILYVNYLADLIPTYHALLFATTDEPQYFGYDGEYTNVLRRTERSVKRFWDIFSKDIQMIGMHGTVLLDVERTAATYAALFGLPPNVALTVATIVRNALLQSQVLDGGDHPLFSFNAFAFTTNGGPIPDKIVMGDGVMAGYEAVGLGDVAPQAIYAHEFAHHIQFENDYFSDPYATTGSSAERTRYTELMADAMSAYYLTHRRGATMNRRRVEEFLEVFFQIGDCQFSNPGHHGTPNQRMAAARFGFDVADAAQKNGHILTSEQFHDLFVAVYPQLIAPDAP